MGKKKQEYVRLNEFEHIVGVRAEQFAGPGWVNYCVIVTIRDSATSKYREHYIQPEHQTQGMHTLFPIGAAVHVALLKEVLTLVKQKGGKK